MQKSTLSSNTQNDRLLDSNTPLRTRISRFLSERYAQRERPSVVPELTIFALIVLVSTWPMFTLAQAMNLGLR